MFFIMEAEGTDFVLLPNGDILTEIPIKENKELAQQLEELHVKSYCQKNGRPVWRPKVVGQADEEIALHSGLQNLEIRSNYTPFGIDDKNEIEDENGADYHNYLDSDLSDYEVSPLAEATQIPGMDGEPVSEKEDWEKELNEACPYDEDDLAIIVRGVCCEVQLVWQDSETYNPSRDHALSKRANVVEIPTVEGQFDDADD
ncbi:uncharacterized protein [Chiloscyllium punctatum]|uniref:Uncharacterized protein n=1 Tax=Chiloscyllium punctatum TaxID=137246 RepID=A0A401SIA1_CHIPU|nr:hypothetical protein [Chiloscyllium punctatum]